MPAERRVTAGRWLVAVGVAAWTAFYVVIAGAGGAGFDSHAYWLTRHGIAYVQDPGEQNAYLYSPAFAHAIRPLTLLPWPVFGLLWSTIAAATYVWLTRRVSWRWRIPLLALCLGDIVYGNVWWLFAVALVYGLRRPVLWAIPLLLKISPAVGLLWFAVRREWRNLATALAAAAVVVAASACIAPDAWLDWFRMLTHADAAAFPDTPVPHTIRMLGAAALTVYAGRTNRSRLLPVALWLGSPVFSLNGLGVFVAMASLPTDVPVPFARRRSAVVRVSVPART